MEKEEEINASEMELCFQWGWTVVSKELSIIQDGRSKGVVWLYSIVCFSWAPCSCFCWDRREEGWNKYRVFEDTQFVLLTLCKSPGHRDREGRAGGSRNCLGMRDLGAERRRWCVCHGQQQGAAHQQQGQKGGEDLGRQRWAQRNISSWRFIEILPSFVGEGKGGKQWEGAVLMWGEHCNKGRGDCQGL